MHAHAILAAFVALQICSVSSFFQAPSLPVPLRLVSSFSKSAHLSLQQPTLPKIAHPTRGSAECRRNGPLMTASAIGHMENLKMPAGMKQSWEVHKFGGASLADVSLYKTVGDLLISESKGRSDGVVPTMAIVSAMSGTTDQLIGVVNAAVKDPAEAKKLLDVCVDKQISTLKGLAGSEIVAPVEANIRKDADNIMGVLQALKLLRTVPAVTLELITGFGEVWSAQTLNAYLKAKGVPCDWIDAREILIVDSTLVGLGEKGSAATAGVNPRWEETSRRMRQWWEEKSVGFDKSAAPIITVTGFVAATPDGVPTTLKRSGSDFSATIFARLLNAARVTMWKNTDGSPPPVESWRWPD